MNIIYNDSIKLNMCSNTIDYLWMSTYVVKVKSHMWEYWTWNSREQLPPRGTQGGKWNEGAVHGDFSGICEACILKKKSEANMEKNVKTWQSLVVGTCNSLDSAFFEYSIIKNK